MNVLCARAATIPRLGWQVDSDLRVLPPPFLLWALHAVNSKECKVLRRFIIM